MSSVLTAGAYAGAIIAVIGVAGLLVGLFKKAVEESISGKLDALQRQLNEADEDLASHNDLIMGKLNCLQESLADVRAQVYPNSGTSLRDRVDELYKLVLET